MFKRLATLVLLAPAVLGGDAYLTVTLDQVTWTSEEPPPLGRNLGSVLRGWPHPEVRCSAEEAWIGVPYRAARWGEALSSGFIVRSCATHASESPTGGSQVPAQGLDSPASCWSGRARSQKERALFVRAT